VVTTDPFERAARREEQEEIRREVMRTRLWRQGRGGTGVAVVVFGVPYIILGLVRASGHAFTTPYGEAIRRYFFGKPGFAIFTAWMLFLVWVWAIEFASRRRRR
jgi:hypothetical protein